MDVVCKQLLPSCSSSCSSFSFSNSSLHHEEGGSGLELLSNEIWVHILSFCHLHDILNFSLTCKKAHLITEDQLLWKHFCRDHLNCRAMTDNVFVSSWKQHVIAVFSLQKHFRHLKLHLPSSENHYCSFSLQKIPEPSTSIITKLINHRKTFNILPFSSSSSSSCPSKISERSSSNPDNVEELILQLLVHGFDPNQRCISDATPMFALAARDRLRKIFQLAHQHFKGDLNVQTTNGTTLLHQAALSNAVKNVKYLLRNNLDPNRVENNLDSPLHWAATRGNLEIVKSLLKKGAKIDLRNSVGDTPLMAAVKSSNSELVRFFLEVHKVDPNERNIFGDTALHLAAEFNEWKNLKILLSFGADPNIRSNWNDLPVHYASKNTSPKFIKKLEKHGSQLNSQGNGGFTLLHYAAAHEHQYETLEWLLDNVLSPTLPIDAPDAAGNSPLLVAAHRGLLANVQLLVERGASIQHNNHQGWTALLAAQATNNKTSKQVCTWLEYFLEATKK